MLKLKQKALECLVKIFVFESNVWHLGDRDINYTIVNDVTKDEYNKIHNLRAELIHDNEKIFHIKYIIAYVLFVNSQTIKDKLNFLKIPLLKNDDENLQKLLEVFIINKENIQSVDLSEKIDITIQKINELETNLSSLVSPCPYVNSDYIYKYIQDYYDNIINCFATECSFLDLEKSFKNIKWTEEQNKHLSTEQIRNYIISTASNEYLKQEFIHRIKDGSQHYLFSAEALIKPKTDRLINDVKKEILKEIDNKGLGALWKNIKHFYSEELDEKFNEINDLRRIIYHAKIGDIANKFGNIKQAILLEPINPLTQDQKNIINQLNSIRDKIIIFSNKLTV